MKIKLSLSLLVITASCSTPPSEEKLKIALPGSESQYRQSYPKSGQHNQIDVAALIEELNMTPPGVQLGFQQQAFNTCDVKANRSSNPRCQRLYLIRLNYQIVCRRSKGTVSKVQLHPLNKGRLSWKYRSHRGQTWTDPNGFGSLGFVSPKSASHGHLYFYSGTHVARKRFQDNWKLVLPEAWCLLRN